jgi:hypothetical protein
MKKVKIIKNLGCLIIALGLMIVYIIFHASPIERDYIMPFMMFETLLGCFSLYWSMVKNGKTGMVNVGVIILTMIIALCFIVCQALIAVNPNVDSLVTLMKIFFFILGGMALACFIYAIVLDFVPEKKPIKANEKEENI